MKILVDENIPSITVHELRRLGHDVLDVRGTPRQGIEDAELWRLAQFQERLLITTDKGFAEHREEAHHGIIVVRLRHPNEQRIHARRSVPGIPFVARVVAQGFRSEQVHPPSATANSWPKVPTRGRLTTSSF